MVLVGRGVQSLIARLDSFEPFVHVVIGVLVWLACSIPWLEVVLNHLLGLLPNVAYLINPAVYKLGLLGSARSRASLVLPPPRAEYLVRAQAVHRCRGLPCGAGEEIVWRSRGIAYSVVLVEIWYSLLLVECSTTGTLSVVQAPARLNANSSRKWRW